jgi:AcrR family transcriptional regulator
MATRVRKSKKGEILRVFTERVAERGYDAVTFRELAAELDISKGTIIHHFPNKEMMLEQLHHDYMRRRLAEARQLLATFDEPIDQLRAIVFQLMLAQQDDRAATVAFAREIVRFAAHDLMSDVRAMRRQYSELVEEIIRRGIKRGVFVEVDPRIASLQLFGMCNWSWTWFEPGGAHSADEIAESFCDTLLVGLVQGDPKGVETEDLARKVKDVLESQRSDLDVTASRR